MDEYKKSILMASSLSFVLVTTGVAHLVCAERLSAFYMLFVNDQFLKKLPTFLRLAIESRCSKPWLRIFGAVCVAVGLFLMSVLIRGIMDGRHQ